MRSILNPRATHRNRPITIKMPYIFYKKKQKLVKKIARSKIITGYFKRVRDYVCSAEDSRFFEFLYWFPNERRFVHHLRGN